MSKQTFVNIKSCVEKFSLVFQDEWWKKKIMLLRILDQVQQDNKDVRDGIDKSVATLRHEEDISFEQVLYILFFDAVFIRVEYLYIPFFSFLIFLCENDVIVVEQYEEITYKCNLSLKS